MSSCEQHGHLAASYLITAGMFALMLALHIDCFLVARLIVHDVVKSLALTIAPGDRKSVV